MERRELIRHSLLAFGAGLSGLAPSLGFTQEQKKTYAGQLDMLKGQEGAGNPREAHAYAIGIQAFEYGFPLIYFANIMYKWAKDPNSVMRPLNSWISPKDFVATSNYRDGGSFNTDTVYAGAFIDLRKGPMVLSTKDPEGHYFSVQLSDFYTNNFAYISKRSGGPIFGNFLLLPPGWKGDVPAGKFDRVFTCEQKWIFALIRLRVDQENATEVAWAKDKFAQAKLTPVADFLAGREFVPNDFNVFDVGKFNGNPLRPFAILNYMLAENPPAASDEILLQGFKTVNIGPAMDLSKNDPDTNRGLARAARDALPALRAHVERPWARSVNGWFYFPTNIGQAKTTDYVMRSAWQSLWGIVAHPPYECTYLWASLDQNGERLNSGGKYELYMRKDQFPKVEAFWSFTMYQDFNLVVNDANRWAIRENMKGLKFDADGGLRVYIQTERPSEDKVSNWLPAPKSGNFNITMRNYMPSAEIVEQRYDPPVLKRIS
ncbi:MAG: DUF1214 domain-containing protein [Comamonadaceae bacterium]